MPGALVDLGMTLPLVAAPMAGGPSTPDLVTAAAAAGGLGMLAGGYTTAETLHAQIAKVRASGLPFGVNLFAPNPVPVDRTEFVQYARKLQVEADRYGLTLSDEPVEDDDAWLAKVDVLATDPVPLVTFTFGVPGPDVVTRLRTAGTVVAQTVTNADEAATAVSAGVAALVVQGSGAGGHSGTLTPDRLPADVPIADLIAAVRAVTDLPLIVGGGIATSADVAAALAAGAEAVAVGTVLLLADEAGTSETYRQALLGPAREGTVLTRAFSGRPARALRNDFADRYTEGAPAGYPAVHHLTSPLRKAAAAAGDPERVNLWAGVGHRHASAEPAGAIIARLAAEL